MGENGFLIRDEDLDAWNVMLYTKGLFCEVVESFTYGYVLKLKYKKKSMPLVDEVLQVYSTREEAEEAWENVPAKDKKDKYDGYKIIELGDK